MYVARKGLRSSAWLRHNLCVFGQRIRQLSVGARKQYTPTLTEVEDGSSNATTSNGGQIKDTTSTKTTHLLPHTAAPASLPVSPLVDPAFLAARLRWRRSKASSSREPTLFQRQLAKNPYAQALASPVRMCALTRTWLPSFFLQDFELVRHPTTNTPWYVPRSLTAAVRKQASSVGVSSSIAGKVDDAKSTDQESTSIGPKAYMLSRHDLVAALNTKGSGFHLKHSRFVSTRSRQWKAFTDLEKKSKFRKDMDALVLELMRRRIVERLSYLHGRKKGYLVACKSSGPDVWEEAISKPYIGAVLWLGSASDAVASGLPEFATVDKEREVRSKTLVHDLCRLLGTEHMLVLKGTASIFSTSETIVLTNKTITVDLQLKLWKLQGYLATHSEHT